MDRDEIYVGHGANDFVFETTVKDFLMRKR